MADLLEVENIHSYYGNSHVLQGVSLAVPEGGVVTLLGRNGMGKTTLVRSIMGTPPPKVREGSIRFRSEELVGKPSYRIAQLGLGLVPQGRRIFPSLTVVENLTLGSRPVKHAGNGRKEWNLDRVFEFFPQLEQRSRYKAGQLSGGERQMLAIARAMMTNPDLLLMDEPSEGLAPMLVRQVRDQVLSLKESGASILIVEQNLGLALAVADEVYVLERGGIVYHESPEALDRNDEVKRRHLGV